MTLPFDYQPQLDGKLIAMRPMTETDFEPLYAVASDPLIWEVHPVRERWQRPVFRAFVDDAYAEFGAQVAIEKITGDIAGYSRYSRKFMPDDAVEIGWTFLSRRLWGGAHNRDMKRIMLAHALASFERVIFRVGEDNVRSRRAVTKIGGQLIEWDEVIALDGHKIRNVSFEITRSGFANGPLMQGSD